MSQNLLPETISHNFVGSNSFFIGDSNGNIEVIEKDYPYKPYGTLRISVEDVEDYKNHRNKVMELATKYDTKHTSIYNFMAKNGIKRVKIENEEEVFDEELYAIFDIWRNKIVEKQIPIDLGVLDRIRPGMTITRFVDVNVEIMNVLKEQIKLMDKQIETIKKESIETLQKVSPCFVNIFGTEFYIKLDQQFHNKNIIAYQMGDDLIICDVDDIMNYNHMGSCNGEILISMDEKLFLVDGVEASGWQRVFTYKNEKIKIVEPVQQLGKVLCRIKNPI